MFVTLLLAAGLLALEREEHAFGRLVRGLVSRTALLAEKVGLAALCALAVTLLMLFGLAAFVGLDWSRVAAWLAALAGRRARLRGAWAWRSAAWRARSAPRRCWPSCSRCRSLPRARAVRRGEPGALRRRQRRSRACSRSSRRCDALDAAINGGELLSRVRAPAGADALALRRARAYRARGASR